MEDELYIAKMASAFLDEMTEIEKVALLGGALNFFKGGLRGLSKAVSAPAGTSFARRMGVGKTGLWNQLSHAYKSGAQKGGFREGARRVMAQKPVQIAGTVAAPVAAGYALG